MTKNHKQNIDMISNIIGDPIVPQLIDLTKYSMEKILAKGASDAEVSTGLYSGVCINSRLKKLENVEYNKEKGITVTAYFGNKKGTASTTDINKKSVDDTINAACNIAKMVYEDIYSGLAPTELMAFNYPDLDLYHPWEISVNYLIERAIECESYALDLDDRVTNSEGVSVSTSQSYNIYSNTNGFLGHYPSSKHRTSCILVAGEDTNMQRDYYYTVSRDLRSLESSVEVAKKAVKKTVQRLKPQKLTTRKSPIIFHADIASSLFGCVISAISGSNQYKKSSFLHNTIGLQVLPSWLTMQEKPHLKRGLGSHPFDAEGVMTREKYFIENGIVKNYVLDSYTARRLSLETTGNASGINNLYINNQDISFPDLLSKMNAGLLVTELLGHGINIVTGDYSQGAVGFWVENGEIKYPVDEITIAGNLHDMLSNIISISNDADHRKNILVGSTLVEEMTIAGH